MTRSQIGAVILTGVTVLVLGAVIASQVFGFGQAPFRPYRVIAQVAVPGSGPFLAEPRSGLVYAASADGETVTVFSGAQVVGQVPAPGTLGAWIAADEAGNVFVAHGANEDPSAPFTLVSVISGTRQTGTIRVEGSLVSGLALDTASGLPMVVSGDNRSPFQAHVYELDGLTARARLDLGSGVIAGMTANPLTGGIYLVDASGFVSLVKDGQRTLVLDPVAVFGYSDPPILLTTSQSTADVYLLTYNNVYMIRAGQFVDRAPLGADAWPHALVRHPSGDIYVSLGRQGQTGEVRIFSGATEKGRLEVGAYPHAMTIDPKTGTVFVANAYSDDVTVIHDGQVRQTLSVGTYPYWISFDPTTKLLYTSNDNDGTVSVLSPEDAVYLPTIAR